MTLLPCSARVGGLSSMTCGHLKRKRTIMSLIQTTDVYRSGNEKAGHKSIVFGLIPHEGLLSKTCCYSPWADYGGQLQGNKMDQQIPMSVFDPKHASEIR